MLLSWLRYVEILPGNTRVCALMHTYTHFSTHPCMYTDTKMHQCKYPNVYFFHSILTDIILISFESLTIYPLVHTHNPYPNDIT